MIISSFTKVWSAPIFCLDGILTLQCTLWIIRSRNFQLFLNKPIQFGFFFLKTTTIVPEFGKPKEETKKFVNPIAFSILLHKHDLKYDLFSLQFLKQHKENPITYGKFRRFHQLLNTTLYLIRLSTKIDIPMKGCIHRKNVREYFHLTKRDHSNQGYIFQSSLVSWKYFFSPCSKGNWKESFCLQNRTLSYTSIIG